MIVASQGASFTPAYVKAGLVPDGGATYRLCQAWPRATVARMATLGHSLSAERMYQPGAVTEMTSPESLLSQVLKPADAVARGPEVANTDIKTLLNQAETATFDDHLIHERDAMAKVVGGDQAQAGVSAFLNRKPPVFR